MQLKLYIFFFLSALSISAIAQTPRKFQGQGPIKAASTETVPVQKQWKGTFSFPGSNVFFSNNFNGGRLNGVASVNDTVYSVLITPENIPVNQSPWYAFKVWSAKAKEIIIRLTYQQGRNRYVPKISKNGKDWILLKGTGAESSGTPDSVQAAYQFKLRISTDTTWVAAQELNTSAEMKAWTARQLKKPFITSTTIGQSRLGKPLTLLKIGNPASKNRILIIGRQHPPEVTGQMALSAFLEQLTSETTLAKAFRQNFLIYVVPLMNPDGVDGGFWRHNAGGIDLNRDWYAFNQPETRAVRDFLNKELSSKENKLWFGIDFHSTHDDIYYIVDPKLKGALPGFAQNWLADLQKRVPGYEPNIKPLYSGGPTYTEFSYLHQTYGTEALVYEIGDNTPREFIKKKGAAAADALMELLPKAIKQ